MLYDPSNQSQLLKDFISMSDELYDAKKRIVKLETHIHDILLDFEKRLVKLENGNLGGDSDPVVSS